jgi:hypothetical protein
MEILMRILIMLARRIQQSACGLQGHSIVLHFEPDRLSLECCLCGYHSEGWEVGRAIAARRKAGVQQMAS